MDCHLCLQRAPGAWLQRQDALVCGARDVVAAVAARRLCLLAATELTCFSIVEQTCSSECPCKPLGRIKAWCKIMAGLAQALCLATVRVHKQAAYKPAYTNMSMDLLGQNANATAQVLRDYENMLQGPCCKTMPLRNTQEHQNWLRNLRVSMQVYNPLVWQMLQLQNSST